MTKSKKRRLEGVCLHCAFFRIAKLKWGDNDASDEAFADIVSAAINIASEALGNLDDQGRTEFLRNVMERTAELDSDGGQLTVH